MKSWLEKTKYFVVERFFRTLKNKIYIYMTSITKNVYIDNLNDMVNKYLDNTYHRAIKMKPVDVISKYKKKIQKPMFQIGLKKFL